MTPSASVRLRRGASMAARKAGMGRGGSEGQGGATGWTGWA
jgi:hypothetical protein